MIRSRFAGLLGAVALAATASGCAHAVRGGPELSQRLEGGVEVVYVEGARADGERIARMMPDALAAATRRWGPLRAPLRVEVLPDHAALEDAVDRHGYGWLRAWARYGEVWIQAPSTWGILGASDAAVRELLVHELTHVVMYQRAAESGDWRRKRIPLWFREGMASYTAAQGYRRAGPEAISKWMHERGADPVGSADALYKDDGGIVYATAHHAFAFLVDRYGESEVRALMTRMRTEDETFPAAFEEVLGLPVSGFEADFGRYLRMEGWRKP